jgi:ribosome-associated protein
MHRTIVLVSEMDRQKPNTAGASIELSPGVSVPESAVRFSFARSGGPGGQNVNKLNTKAEIWIVLHAISGLSESATQRLRALAGKRITREDELHLSAQTERTQERNRQAVLDRLRLLIAEALTAPKPRRPTRPSKASKKRRLEFKRRRSQIKAARSGKADD